MDYHVDKSDISHMCLKQQQEKNAQGNFASQTKISDEQEKEKKNKKFVAT